MTDTTEEWAQIKRPYSKYAFGVAVVSFGAIGLALFLQHVMGMEPCAWCTFQRLLYIIIGALALGAFLMWSSSTGVAKTLAALGALTGIGGIASALWQNFVAAGDFSCALTFADKVVTATKLNELMPWLFEATAMCDEANLPMLGIPFSIWSAMLFALLTIVLLVVLFSRAR